MAAISFLPNPRILSVANDELLLRSRHLLLQREGHDIVSALGLAEALKHCRQGGFDLLIVGHPLTDVEKLQLADEFRRRSSGPVIILLHASDPPVADLTLYVDSRPEALLNVVREILGETAVPNNGESGCTSH